MFKLMKFSIYDEEIRKKSESIKKGDIVYFNDYLMVVDILSVDKFGTFEILVRSCNDLEFKTLRARG